MGLKKRDYTDQETLITAENLNDIQDAILDLEDGLFSIDNVKSGEVITITDATKRGFRNLNIYGKTTQNGTPTPDAPVDLVSVGNSGSITVNVTSEDDAQSMTIATPNGLPGIPVSSGGNYADANGQQWVCDEIDLARGVYVQRILTETVTAEKITVEDSVNASNGGKIAYFRLSAPHFGNDKICLIMCDRALGMACDNRTEQVEVYRCYAPESNPDVICFRYPVSAGEKTLDEVVADFVGATICYVTRSPIETPLSEEELAAYSALHTYRNHTTVSNDAGAYMELEYVMDAKKYIDSLIKVSGGSSARVAEVTLYASKWVVNGTIHSQVVQINGVTENSQVDLTPSVEQLAIFHDKDLAFVTENEDGVVTVYALGDKPTSDYTMQVTITEVYV